MEQDRPSLILFHQSELARQANDQPEVIISLIAATTTTTGLAVKSKLDTNIYPAGVKVSDQQMAELQLRRDRFRGGSVLPRR